MSPFHRHWRRPEAPSPPSRGQRRKTSHPGFSQNEGAPRGSPRERRPAGSLDEWDGGTVHTVRSERHRENVPYESNPDSTSQHGGDVP